MRRVGELWSRVTAFAALCHAAKRAGRGGRATRAVARFFDRLEPECLELGRRLEADTWRPGATTTFAIRDPKPRTITVTPFADRVVHHALMAPLEPIFERRMVAHSYACRTDKGSARAVRHAQILLRRYRYSLRLDVASFFGSLDHAVVAETLARIIKDRRVLRLCRRVTEGPPECTARVGLPIGSVTSQWFANLVLDRLDHHVTETLRLGGYVRYMDDFVLFANDRDRLRAAHGEVAAYLRDTLRLRLKERATRLAPTSEGLPFLGWSIRRGTVRVRAANLRRSLWRLRLRRWQFEHGERSAEAFCNSVRAVYAYLAQGQTVGLRRRWVAREDR
ncbi:MAG: reverse transcriptase/maturase family protein [Planctomycetota bacterium]